MSDFELFIACLLAPIIYILTYIAGKYDILKLICKMLEEEFKKIEERRKGV